ncbi:G-type lectin S-receptor-like serine/threonine-protein kinase LECRK3 [Quercus suber]|uniref:G-type lectin S-receptor-like serine/threonine-protein kinase LECRK3 n=1 Tax=Quercus suber TaxID=58331 RepID=UPI000CE22D7C|nr:G-type lectin S-receptor-like serine/threonine-protein kinase LECRK3 [Quercus suber]
MRKRINTCMLFGLTATQGSELKLSSKNEFVLNDPQGKELWKAPRNGSKSSCAAILDNGNLLTLDEQYNSIWESIKEPTNTILPGQILYMKTTLRSRESEANYSDGRFKLSLQRVSIQHPRNGDTPSSGNESCSSSWIEVQSIPNDICGTLIDVVAAGGGFCGPNGHCRTPVNSNGPAFCSCPDGFSPLDQSKKVVGCNENACWKKKFPLSNGRYRESNTSIVLIKENIGSDKKDQSMVVVLALLLGSSVFLNILFFIASIVAFVLYRKRLNSRWNIDSTLATNVRSYTHKELEEATSGFKQTVGKGASGTVYKGVLPSDSKRFVAVKKLGKVVEEGEKEFKTKVSVIGQTHHKNFVRLLGYCDEGQLWLLVYEYISNGSLASFLFGISRPHWNQRVQIAFGIARGLMYLHEECSTQIIHCDINPQNILLDEYFTPRIADFGLAKLLLAEQTRVTHTAIRGTFGYFAPEWFRKASILVKAMFTVLM